jgi:hypothetical protein
VPRYVDYLTFAANLQHEVEHFGFDDLLAEAKGFMTAAQQRIGRLIAVEDGQRNTLHLPNEML